MSDSIRNQRRINAVYLYKRRLKRINERSKKFLVKQNAYKTSLEKNLLNNDDIVDNPIESNHNLKPQVEFESEFNYNLNLPTIDLQYQILEYNYLQCEKILNDKKLFNITSNKNNQLQILSNKSKDNCFKLNIIGTKIKQLFAQVPYTFICKTIFEIYLAKIK